MTHQVKIRNRHLKTINTNQIDLVSIGVNPAEFRNKQNLSGKSIKRLAKRQRLHDRNAKESLRSGLTTNPGEVDRPILED